MITQLIRLCLRYAKWIPAIFVFFTIVLITLTLIPGDLMVNKVPNGTDKLSHTVFFYTWTILFWLVVKILNPSKTLPLWIIFIIASCLGITIEMLQYLLPVDRGMELLDIIANTIGISIGLLTIWYLKQQNFSRYLDTNASR